MPRVVQKSVLRRVGAVFIPLILAGAGVWTGGPSGCGTGPGGPTISGGNPATPPGPPAEVPSALRFPESIAIDVGTIAPAEGGSALSALVAEGDDIGDFVDSLARNSQDVFELVDSLLAPLHQLIIPANPEVKSLQDILFVGEDLVEVKIDFADFDEDGDGVTEGCSGHTASLPICFRIWFDGERHLAGVFEHFPTEENAGSGRFRGLPENEFLLKALGPFFLGASYDFHDPSSNKATELFIGATGDPSGSSPTLPENESGFRRHIHALITQIGPDETATKSANASVDDQPGSTDETTKRRQVGRWTEGASPLLFSGSNRGIIDPDPPGPFQEFSAACALIETGIVVNRGQCLDAGIDVGVVGVDSGAVDFVDFLTLSDVAPFNFPETPTF